MKHGKLIKWLVNLPIFSVILSFISGGRTKVVNSCKYCKFNRDFYCNVGSKYAEKGQNALCYNGELWEGNEA